MNNNMEVIETRIVFPGDPICKPYNQKENVMPENNVPNCCAIVKGDLCGNNGKYVVNCYVKGINAYRYDALPERYVGGGWLIQSLPVCGTHKNVLSNGKALSVRFKAEIPTPAPEQQKLEIDAPVATQTVKKGIKCANCKEYHNTPAEVRACFGAPAKPVNNNGDYFLQNTQVKKINDPFKKSHFIADKMEQAYFGGGRRIANPYKNR